MSGLSFLRELANAARLRGESDPDQVAAAARQFSEFADIGRGAYSEAIVAQGLLLAGAMRLKHASDPISTAHYLRAMAAVVERGERKAG